MLVFLQNLAVTFTSWCLAFLFELVLHHPAMLLIFVYLRVVLLFHFLEPNCYFFFKKVSTGTGTMFFLIPIVWIILSVILHIKMSLVLPLSSLKSY